MSADSMIVPVKFAYIQPLFVVEVVLNLVVLVVRFCSIGDVVESFI